MLKQVRQILGDKNTFPIDDLNRRIIGLDKSNIELESSGTQSRGAASRSGAGLSDSGASADLVNLFQSKLLNLGLLDPIFEGDAAKPFGPSAKTSGVIDMDTRNALAEFCKLTGLTFDEYALTASQLEKLDAVSPDTFLPVEFDAKPGDDTNTLLAKRVLRYMRAKGYWIARSPNMYNIAYVEGMNSDGTLNKDLANEWNDRRLVIQIQKGGRPKMVVNDQATTEPGKFYTDNPLNKAGAARMAFGQYKAWMMGKHQGWQPALVQRGLLKVHRDGNKNYVRDGADVIDIGSVFGVNQHSTSPGQLPAVVGKYSAGCLVGRNYDSHQAFLKILAKDVRYQLNNGYMFVSCVIAGDNLIKTT